MIYLKKLTAQDDRDIYEMLQEIPADENGFMNSANGKTFDEYKEWLKRSFECAKQTDIVDCWKVPETVFWLYDGGHPVGFGKIRHFLTDALRAAGGNVGYAIRPTERGKGYGNEIVELLISEAQKMGVGEILLTVHADNEVSLKAALNAGGKIIKTENSRYYIEF